MNMMTQTPAPSRKLIGVTALERLRAFWRRIEPGIDIHETRHERWDENGDGRAWCVSFEGFGITFSIFFGLTPPVRAGMAGAAPHSAREQG